jgi:hypothetical protein
MAARPNPLLRLGAEAEWARIEKQERRLPASRRESIEQRLMRGQRLSAQAARLRRSVRHDNRLTTGP